MSFPLILNKKNQISVGDNIISLLLVFQRNGLVRFLCLDDENDENEKQTFLIEGNFSASNMFSKMHKINRLLKLISYD